jgi:hypothetical protein
MSAAKISMKSMPLRALRGAQGGAQGWDRKNPNKINAAQGAQGVTGGKIAPGFRYAFSLARAFLYLLFSFVASTASGHRPGWEGGHQWCLGRLLLLVVGLSDAGYFGSAAPVKYLWDIGDFRIWSATPG